MKKKYDTEFKIKAIKLASKIENAALAGKNLNIGKGSMWRWKKEIKVDKNGNVANSNSNNFQDKIIKKLK